MELPEECISDILCRTTPLDVARISVVSKIFCSAADSDTIWDHFLPSDYRSIISQSLSVANAPSKKAIYLALSDRPIIIDEGKRSFQLDRKSGKKCYMLSARALNISNGEDERYCRWVTLPESRFEEVPMLKDPLWFAISGKINTVDLSSSTQYAVFLVYKLVTTHGSYYEPVLLLMRILGGRVRTKKACLAMRLKENSMNSVPECPNMRSDGLLEIEMGEFFNLGLEDGEVEMNVMITQMFSWNGSFYLEGIEVRPKISRPIRNGRQA
ncbi:putative F-box protein PP2-B12 [Lotus japonicus]|uniref:putative F-box protein PP2-B12 n=1 Tax=Lotus japonicus TaxID=34305 RepID=UPI00258BEB72|nr:putative F-box protein PP2-B12 [Lotus japonicus]